MKRAIEGGQSVENGRALAREKYIEPLKQKIQLETITEIAFEGQKGKEHKIKFNIWNSAVFSAWAKEITRLLVKYNLKQRFVTHQESIRVKSLST